MYYILPKSDGRIDIEIDFLDGVLNLLVILYQFHKVLHEAAVRHPCSVLVSGAQHLLGGHLVRHGRRHHLILMLYLEETIIGHLRFHAN